MAKETESTALVAVAVERRYRASRSQGTLADYWELTKPEVNLLILITTGAAFYLGYPTQGHLFPFALLIHTLLGTLLVAGGTGTLNQFVEWRFDAQMRRTAWRPIPAGRLAPSAALRFGILLTVAGSIYLAAAVNTLASFLAVLTSVSYLFLYTPLKRRTPLCPLVGALPGAIPPLIGWAAASGGLSLESSILYALLFLWQLPHVTAIAWMYREDYERAGYLVLPQGEGQGSAMAWQSILPTVLLVPISIIPMLGSHAGLIYPAGALVLSSTFFCFGAELAIRRSNLAARRLLLASIIYLPFVLLLMVLDKFLAPAR